MPPAPPHTNIDRRKIERTKQPSSACHSVTAPTARHSGSSHLTKPCIGGESAESLIVLGEALRASGCKAAVRIVEEVDPDPDAQQRAAQVSWIGEEASDEDGGGEE